MRKPVEQGVALVFPTQSEEGKTCWPRISGVQGTIWHVGLTKLIIEWQDGELRSHDY